MKLVVTEIDRDDYTLDTIVMTPCEFSNISTQPYIASSKFDVIVVDITPKVDLTVIQKVMTTSLVIPRIVSDIDSFTISFLATLYKESSAELRYNFIRHKEMIVLVINKLRTTYNWDSFY